MIITSFQLDDKDRESYFFEETFLLADISMDITFGILSLILGNVKINFNNQELKQRSYTAAKALSTTKQVDIIGKKEFAVAVFDSKDETFIIHIASLTIANTDKVHLFCKAKIALLKVDGAFKIVLTEYSNFADVISPELIMELPKQTKINDHGINFIKSKQLSQKPIFSPEPVELQT